VWQTGFCVLRIALFTALIVATAVVSGCTPEGSPQAVEGSPEPQDVAEPQEETEDVDELSTVRIALPFSPDEIEGTWAVRDDMTLIAQRLTENEYDVAYYLVSMKVVAGAGDKPEVRHISPTHIEFLCHGEGDTPFIDFPYVSVYDIEAEDWTRRDVWRDPCDALQFGGSPIEGQELTDVWMESGAVSLRFRTVPETMPSHGGPITRIPRTLAEWSEEKEALVLRLYGTQFAEGLTEQVRAIQPEGFVRGCRVEAGSEGSTVLYVLLTERALYNITYTFGEPRTMTVRFKAMSEE